ncbi:HEPN domain-containing protein [Candidatus Peregrinibacteria bacterium]|nr:HEPN domain-containing protein [Candidatus Peregrinibacteria bacterium]
MTKEQIVQHWRKGSRESFRLAELAVLEGSYALALFHCHLAVEKMLKAQFIEELNQDPPPTHDLLVIALKLKRKWTQEEERILADLTDYAVAARYDDPTWAKRQATAKNSRLWIARVRLFLSSFT